MHSPQFTGCQKNVHLAKIAKSADLSPTVGCLTFPAASARDDNVETERLLNSAPRVWRKQVHHTSLITARTVIGFIYQLEQLTYVAAAFACGNSTNADGDDDEPEHANFRDRTVGEMAYLFCHLRPDERREGLSCPLSPSAVG